MRCGRCGNNKISFSKIRCLGKSNISITIRCKKCNQELIITKKGSLKDILYLSYKIWKGINKDGI